MSGPVEAVFVAMIVLRAYTEPVSLATPPPAAAVLPAIVLSSRVSLP